MVRHSSHILELARKGADHRYQELKAQMALVLKAFPHLRSEPKSDLRFKPGKELLLAPAPRGRRKMSTAERKAVSARMTRHWAARRKEKAPK